MELLPISSISSINTPGTWTSLFGIIKWHLCGAFTEKVLLLSLLMVGYFEDNENLRLTYNLHTHTDLPNGRNSAMAQWMPRISAMLCTFSLMPWDLLASKASKASQPWRKPLGGLNSKTLEASAKRWALLIFSDKYARSTAIQSNYTLRCKGRKQQVGCDVCAPTHTQMHSELS